MDSPSPEATATHIPVDPSATPTGEAPTLAPAPEESAAAFGSVAIPGFEIVGELGRGGMGVVYKAVQLRPRRPVALKMILAGVHAGSVEVLRFLAEAEAIARLRHANIVQIYEVGQHEGKPFFSLEFCDGGSLAGQLNGTPLPSGQAAALIETLAHAMQHAHDQGIVHRDLKPANVLLQNAGTSPSKTSILQTAIPKITDFGLAKQAGADLTASGAMMGTPSYMAPEQAEARKGAIGPAADVYALGAILYECLTGRPPFRAATVVDTIMQVVGEEPVPPSQLNPKTPRDLETICLKCLEKPAARRYTSAAALAEDLRRFRAHEPITARPVGSVERAWRWCLRNRAVAASLLVVALALVAGTVVSLIFAVQAGEEAGNARRAQGEAEKAQAQESFQREEAQKLARANRQQAIDLMMWRGNRLLRDGEACAALPWLAEAIRLDPDNGAQRTRLDAVLRTLPRLRALWRQADTINHLAVSADNRRIAAAGNDGVARVWDLETGQPIGPPLKHEGPVFAVAFSPDGQRLASVGGAMALYGEVHVWDVASGQAFAKPIKGKATVVLAGFTADGSRLIVMDFDPPLAPGLGFQSAFSAHVYDATRPELPLLRSTKLGSHGEPDAQSGSQIVHAASGRALIVGDKQATVHDLLGGKAVGTPLTLSAPIWFSELTPDGRHAVLVGTDRSVCARDLDTGTTWNFSTAYHWRPVAASFDGRGELVLAFYDGSVQRYQLDKGRPADNSSEKLGEHGWSPHFSDDGAFLVGLGSDGTLRSWETYTRQPLSPVLRHGCTLSAFAFAAAGRCLVVGGTDGSVRVWDLAQSEKARASLHNPAFQHTSLVFDADGRGLLLGQGTVWRFDPVTLKAIDNENPVADPQARSWTVARDGLRLAVGNDQGEVRLRDLATGKDMGAPLKHGKPFVLDMAFSPNGRWLAARGADGEQGAVRYLGELQLWDLTTRAAGNKDPIRYGAIRGLGGVTCMAFSADSVHVAVGGGSATAGGVQGEVVLYEAATGQPTGRTFRGPPGFAPEHVMFSPDGRFLAAILRRFPSMVGQVVVWELATGAVVLEGSQAGELHDCAFDPAGPRLAIAAGKQMHVWDLESKSLLYSAAHGHELHRVSYQNGGRVLLGIAAKEVSPWDAASGEALRLPIRSPTDVLVAALTPNGQTLVTVSNDRKALFWDLVSDAVGGAELEQLGQLSSGQSMKGTIPLPLPLERLAADWAELHARHPNLFRPTNEMILDWHDHRTSLFFSGDAVAAEPHMEYLAEKLPDNTWVGYLASATHLAAGNDAALRRRCEKLLERNAQTTDPYLIDYTVKSCLIKPGVLADLTPALRLAERQEKVDPQNPNFHWFALDLGLAHYRAGRPDAAALWLEKSRAAKRGRPDYCTPLCNLFLAMTRHQQGRAADAQKLLAEARQAYDTLEKTPSSMGMQDRIHCRTAFREAERLIGKTKESEK